jgi:tRNA A37 methylthiotransferase MiaB
VTMNTPLTPYGLHQEFIRRKIEAMLEYVALCEFQDLPPLHVTTSLLARMIRKYRKANKFYDTV